MLDLGEIDVEEEGFLGVGDLDPVLLVRIPDAEAPYCVRDLLHRHR